MIVFDSHSTKQNFHVHNLKRLVRYQSLAFKTKLLYAYDTTISGFLVGIPLFCPVFCYGSYGSEGNFDVACYWILTRLFMRPGF